MSSPYKIIKCRACDTEKPSYEYNKSKTVLGFSTRCKACDKLAARKNWLHKLRANPFTCARHTKW